MKNINPSKEIWRIFTPKKKNKEYIWPNIFFEHDWPINTPVKYQIL
jgi:hypothetical protein